MTSMCLKNLVIKRKWLLWWIKCSQNKMSWNFRMCSSKMKNNIGSKKISSRLIKTWNTPKHWKELRRIKVRMKESLLTIRAIFSSNYSPKHALKTQTTSLSIQKKCLNLELLNIKRQWSVSLRIMWKLCKMALIYSSSRFNATTQPTNKALLSYMSLNLKFKPKTLFYKIHLYQSYAILIWVIILVKWPVFSSKITQTCFITKPNAQTCQILQLQWNVIKIMNMSFSWWS